VLEEENIPEDWKKNFIATIFKGKGEVYKCGNYRGIKIFEKRLQRRI